MKKFILVTLLFISCSSESVTTNIEIVEAPQELQQVSNSSTTTTTVLESQLLTLDDYIGEAFEPAYSPNELLFFEKDMNDAYHRETRNKLIEESLINLTITETTEYKNTVIFGDDAICEEDEWIIEDASEEGVSPEEFCNKFVTVSDWNTIRYPIFKDEVPNIFKDTSFDEKPIGKCLDSLNESVYDFANSYSDFNFKEVKESKNLGVNVWHRNIFEGDFQVVWISPRDVKEDGSIKYGDATYISGTYPYPPSFFLRDINDWPKEFGVISIIFDFYKYYAGAANGKWFIESFNYDLVNCKRIYLDDIFSSKNLNKELYDGDELIPQSYPQELLDKWTGQETDAWVYALNYEYSKVQCLLDNEFCDELKYLTFNFSPSKDLFKDFAIDAYGIIFFFDKYQISCGACSSPFPLIQDERLFRILDFSALEGGS